MLCLEYLSCKVNCSRLRKLLIAIGFLPDNTLTVICPTEMISLCMFFFSRPIAEDIQTPWEEKCAPRWVNRTPRHWARRVLFWPTGYVRNELNLFFLTRGYIYAAPHIQFCHFYPSFCPMHACLWVFINRSSVCLFYPHPQPIRLWHVHLSVLSILLIHL